MFASNCIWSVDDTVFSADESSEFVKDTDMRRITTGIRYEK
jgi:hypothetical protein